MAVKDIGPRIGADPEVFIRDVATKQIIPVCGKVGGTKEKPIDITSQVVYLFGNDGGSRRRDVDSRGIYAVQEDNVMLEFNIPAFREIDLMTNAISRAIDTISATILVPKGFEFAWGASPEYSFQEEVLNKYEQALEIGCSPDFYAYAEEERFQREPYTATFLGTRRYCGGHIHVQYDYDNVPKHVFAQFMDCVAALPYLAWDKQGTRRLFYGQPGLFRPKDYGIEYRTLSNFWLQPEFRSAILLDMLDNIMHLALLANNNPDHLINAYPKIPWEDVQSAIRTEDPKLGGEIVSYLRHKLGLSINLVPERASIAA